MTETEPTTALAERPPTAVVQRPVGGRPMLFAGVLQQEQEQRDLLKKYIQQNMAEGTDYGVIPGTDKRTLLKPGAEKLTDLFRCTATYTMEQRIEDWDKPLFHYLFRAQVVNRETGDVIAEGFGSANSREGRYRWRNGERKCPSCGKATIIKGKAEFGGGWLCFGKKGGCNAKFRDGDRSIESQEVGRVENDDVYTMANTILKMAKKRALVDAAIALARCSDIFTQDVEDLGEDPEETRRPEPAKTQPKHQQQPVNTGPQTDPNKLNQEKCKQLVDLFHSLDRSWSDEKTKTWVSGLIGRPVAVNDHVSTLTNDEGQKVWNELKRLIAERDAKRAKREATKEGAA